MNVSESLDLELYIKKTKHGCNVYDESSVAEELTEPQWLSLGGESVWLLASFAPYAPPIFLCALAPAKISVNFASV